MEKEQRRVPRAIPILAMAVFAIMFAYAQFIDKPAPEKVVQEFYNAYFTHDFDTVAENLSVFWSANFLSGYDNVTPQELIKSRDEIEQKTAATIAKIEEGNSVPENVNIEVMSQYTKQGKNSAIVAYNFTEDTTPMGMELALLIKENGKFRIFNLSPANEFMLKEIENLDITTLDENFEKLLSSK